MTVKDSLSIRSCDIQMIDIRPTIIALRRGKGFFLSPENDLEKSVSNQ
jgi:hypothetical protein